MAPLGVDVGIAYFSWIDTDMVRGAETHQPAFARLRSELRGPAGRTLPVSAAGAAIAGAVADRRRTVVAPGLVRVAFLAARRSSARSSTATAAAARRRWTARRPSSSPSAGPSRPVCARPTAPQAFATTDPGNRTIG